MNVMKIRAGMVATAFIVALAIGLAAPASSQAGCLKEFGECGDCAEAAMLDALRRYDPGDFMDSYVDALDCEIDLIHCLLYAQHHSYNCKITV